MPRSNVQSFEAVNSAKHVVCTLCLPILDKSSCTMYVVAAREHYATRCVSYQLCKAFTSCQVKHYVLLGYHIAEQYIGFSKKQRKLSFRLFIKVELLSPSTVYHQCVPSI